MNRVERFSCHRGDRDHHGKAPDKYVFHKPISSGTACRKTNFCRSIFWWLVQFDRKSIWIWLKIKVGKNSLNSMSKWEILNSSNFSSFVSCAIFLQLKNTKMILEHEKERGKIFENLTYFRTWWTRSRMTENQTLMSAVRLEVFFTSFSTRMRNDPRIKLWIRDFSTVASVFLGRFRLGVSCPAFGTAPFQILFQILDWKRSGQVY